MPRIKLVLLPGLDGTGVLFRPLIQALAAEIEPVVISYPDAEAWGYDALLPFVMARLPRDKPFVLLGESFGGPLAIRIAATRPAALRGLILSASFVSCPHHFARTWSAPLIRPFLFHFLPSYARSKALLGCYANDELAALSAEALGRVVPRVFALRMQETIRVKLAQAFKQLRLPMLYIQGANDLVVPAANLRRIRAIQREIQWLRLPAPHMVLQTQPALSARAIEQFIEEKITV